MAGPYILDRVRETSTTTGTGTLTLAGAATGYRSFSAVGDGNTCYYSIGHQSAAEWETGIGTYATAGTTLARTTVLTSSNSNNAVSFSAGTKDVMIAPIAKLSPSPVCNSGRLTLSSGVPVLQSTVASSGSVYFEAFEGYLLDLKVGAGWIPHDISAVTAWTVSISSGQVKTIFMNSSSGVATLSAGTGWADDVTPYEAFAWDMGRLVKSSDHTYRVVGVVIGNGANTVGMTESQAGVCNVLHRRPWGLSCGDTTGSWTYTTDTYREANASSIIGTSRVGVVQINGDYAIDATNLSIARSTAANTLGVAIGIDSSTSASGYQASNYTVGGSVFVPLVASYRGAVGVGYHTIRRLEKSQASGTTTWLGGDGTYADKTGMTVTVWV